MPIAEENLDQPLIESGWLTALIRIASVDGGKRLISKVTNYMAVEEICRSRNLNHHNYYQFLFRIDKECRSINACPIKRSY
jgi:hypothetical protein